MDDDSLLNQSVDLPGDPTGNEPIEVPRYRRPPSRKRLWILVLAIALIVAVLIIWKVSSDNKPAATTSNQSSDNPAPAATNQADDLPLVTQTTIYDNGPLGVTLTHPNTWQVTEASNKGIRVNSPPFSYETFDGKTVTGYFKIYIRKGARTQDSAVIGRGVAISESQKITYTNPALGQRSDTLLSLFGLDDSQSFNYFFVAGNFLLNKGDTLGPDYGKEPETFIVAGGYASDQLAEDMGFNSVDTSLISTSNAYQQAIDIIKSLELH